MNTNKEFLVRKYVSVLFHSLKQSSSGRVKRQLDLAGHYLTNHEVNRLLDDKTHQIFYRELNPISVAAKMAVEVVGQMDYNLYAFALRMLQIDILSLLLSKNRSTNCKYGYCLFWK